MMAIFAIVLVVALAGGYMWLRSYLHSEAFRKFLAAELGDAANVEAVFGPFRWDGLAVQTEGVDAEGEELVSFIHAERIATEIGFGGVSRGVWEIKATRIHKLEVGLDFTGETEEELEEKDVAGDEERKAHEKGWVPKDVEMESLEISDFSLMAMTKEGPVAATGMRVLLEPASGKKSYKVSVDGGDLKTSVGWLPPLAIETLNGRYGDGDVFITEAEVSAWSEGRITGAGEWSAESEIYSFEGQAKGLKCDEILDETWARKLQGDVEAVFSVNNLSGEFAASGNLTLSNGVLTAMPVLDILAAYADTRRFRTIPLSEAHTDWRYSDRVTYLTNLVVASDGLLRLEGDVTVRGDTIDGRLRLGVVPGLLANLPGAETHVFKPGERGMLWTSVHITGTLDDPEEDLSERLIIAAGFRILEGLPEGADKVVEITKSVLGDNPEEVIERGEKIIKEGEKVIDDASGIIKGLLGD
ncbi:MAG: AsmA-like C-terminal region-containing protein [Akkermansiaceae bacterium]|nr:AsmA-like C-terminal region-containing protein [Akkermansiaceae bacterium]MDP4721093.1 AsmA-like C-terminal region-containing protein [Akkermansiaceae bacterium]